MSSLGSLCADKSLSIDDLAFLPVSFFKLVLTTLVWSFSMVGNGESCMVGYVSQDEANWGEAAFSCRRKVPHYSFCENDTFSAPFTVSLTVLKR
jgi:hypothetical protein